MRARLYQLSTSRRVLEAISWIIPFVAIVSIFFLVSAKTQNITISQHLANVIDVTFLSYFLPVLLVFTFLNILVEALKWRLAVKPELELSTTESYYQTLMASTAGFITPFRSGALVSRMISNNQAEKNLIIRKTLFMAIAQFVATSLFGIIGLNYFLLFIEEINYLVLIPVNLVFILLLSYAIIKPEIFRHKKYNWLEVKFDLKLFGLSCLRYIIFAFQYFLILKLFGVVYPVVSLFSLIFLSFFVNTLLPAGILGKIGVRELTGILIIGNSTGFIIETSCAAFFIWGLNQALPALTGTFIYLNRNFRNS